MNISAKESWNEIVNWRNKLINAPEIVVQNEWETYLSELFGYSKILGEICPHLKIKVGVADKVIDDITVKINKTPVFLVELKRYCFQKQDTFVEQLKSYLTLFHLSIGVLVCDAVYIYYYDYSKNETHSLKIEFKTDNEYGIKFIELFRKETFDKEAVKNYILSEIQKRIEEAKRANELKEKITKIKEEIKCIDIKELLKNHFIKTYDEAAVTAALNGLEVTFIATNKSKIPALSVPVNKTINNNANAKKFITKSGAIKLFRQDPSFVNMYHGNTVFASKNRSAYTYWANPNVELLNKDWYLILNDTLNCRLYLFYIPRKSIKVTNIAEKYFTEPGEKFALCRSDKCDFIDLQIAYNDKQFTDTRSNLKFIDFYKKQLNY